jgi:hypothetical protein
MVLSEPGVPLSEDANALGTNMANRQMAITIVTDAGAFVFTLPPGIWINVADYAPTLEQCATAYHSSTATSIAFPCFEHHLILCRGPDLPAESENVGFGIERNL